MMARINPSNLLRDDRIYILPSRNGVVYLAVNLIILLTAATYNNNLIYLLSFIMFSIFFISMIQANINLKKVKVQYIKSEDNEVDQPLKFIFKINNMSKSNRYALSISPRIKKSEIIHNGKLSVIDPGEGKLVVMEMKSLKRGVYNLPIINLTTLYPLGLFKPWKRYQFSEKYYVYPKAEGGQPLSEAGAEGLSELPSRVSKGKQQGQEFKGHRAHMQGESYRHVDWKLYARKRKLLKKEFESENVGSLSLKFSDVKKPDLEVKLSQLAQWLKKADSIGLPYELVLPTGKISLGEGKSQFAKCQRALAMYGAEK